MRKHTNPELTAELNAAPFGKKDRVADRRRLMEKAGTVTGSVMSRIEEGLKLVLGM